MASDFDRLQHNRRTDNEQETGRRTKAFAAANRQGEEILRWMVPCKQYDLPSAAKYNADRTGRASTGRKRNGTGSANGRRRKPAACDGVDLMSSQPISLADLVGIVAVFVLILAVYLTGGE